MHTLNTHRKQTLTFNVKSHSLTLVWAEDCISPSLSLAFIWSCVCSHNRSDGVIVSRFAECTTIFKPQVLPSGRDINVTAKENWISSMHHMVYGVLHQCDSGFCICGEITNAIAPSMTAFWCRLHGTTRSSWPLARCFKLLFWFVETLQPFQNVSQRRKWSCSHDTVI